MSDAADRRKGAMDWSRCAHVESMPGKMSGAWVLKGTRVPADDVVENAGFGFSDEEIASEIFEGVPVECIRGVLRYAEAHGLHPA